MKHILCSCLILCCFIRLQAQSPAARGAWSLENDGKTYMLLITPGYFTLTVYGSNTFEGTYGGTLRSASGNDVAATQEFNTFEKSKTGAKETATLEAEGNKLVTTVNGNRTEWQRIDDGNGALSGYWQISGREHDGKMNEIKPGARKTIKVLTGTRFQWIAINTETGEFFGSGGGRYTFENGTYTEHIGFFSRDSSRVGASLSFKGSVSGNNWDHSGLSSKGDPIHEIWTRSVQP